MRPRRVVALTIALGSTTPTLALAEAPEQPSASDTAPTTVAQATSTPSAHAGDAPDTEGADAEPEKVAGGVPRSKAGESAPAWEDAPAEHRGGFAMGLGVGLGIGAANGFPNDAKQIGREAFYTESGLGLATGGSLWIGGALADWLTVGVGGGFSRIFADGVQSDAPIMLFHSDVYPLYTLGGAWRDVGAVFDMGLGFPKAVDTATDETLIDGSGASYVFVGATYEGIELGPLKLGPYAGLHHMFSQTIRRPLALVGFRVSFYGAP
jgi:hypothetical protein